MQDLATLEELRSEAAVSARMAKRLSETIFLPDYRTSGGLKLYDRARVHELIKLANREAVRGHTDKFQCSTHNTL